MEIINNLVFGFSIGLQPGNLLFCFIGVLFGTLVGVLPGIGPMGAMALLLPMTFRMTPVTSIIMLGGIYYGSIYGGAITSILLNIPGEAATIVTCLDGHPMAKKGRAGPALGMSAFASFIAGSFGLIGLVVFAVPLSEFSLRFGPPEYAALIFMGISLVIYLSQGSIWKTLVMAMFGIILSCIGIDSILATPRMTFDLMALWDGIGLVPIAMGLFGIAEVLVNIESAANERSLGSAKIKGLFPGLADWMQAKWSIVRGSILGFFIGLLPGGHPVIASFLEYSLEKKVSKHPQDFGKGAIEGVAGPEAANNGAVVGNFIPLFTLGLPTNPTIALLFGALMIHGLQPGPFLLANNPEVFWGVASSMYLGNVMLLVLNLPLIPLWVQVLKVPYRILFPLIIVFCIVGAYSINNNVADVVMMMLFGVFGYLCRKFEYDVSPLMLAFVLGPMLEINLRQALLMSNGSFAIFVNRPISAIFVVVTALVFVSASLPFLRRKKQRYDALTEDE
jgi:putative tricarboxylic transport membrane protein